MRRNARKRSRGRFVDRKNGIIDPRDTISRLPDHILHHMISFLPSSAKEQVRSLSRNWRQLNKETQRALSMIGHRLDEQELSRILAEDFPSVEFLSLKKCSGMRTLRLEKLKLKNIELKYCGSLKNLQLDTPNLEAFLFHGPRLRPCTIEFGLCKKLKVVHLVGVAMNKTMFTDCNESFPLLQELIIGACDSTGCIKISSNSLERLSFLRFNTSVQIHINAPNLESFVYNGSTIPSLIMPFPHLISAELELYLRPYQKRDETWFPALLKFLRSLGHIQKLTFHSKFDENIIVPKELRETLDPPFDGMPFIEIKTNSRSNNIVHLTDAMLWLCPRAGSLFFSSSKWAWEFNLQLVHGFFSVARSNACSFCASHTSRCWRHSVMKYKVRQTFDEFKLETMDFLLDNLQKVGRHAASNLLFQRVDILS